MQENKYGTVRSLKRADCLSDCSVRFHEPYLLKAVVASSFWGPKRIWGVKRGSPQEPRAERLGGGDFWGKNGWGGGLKRPYKEPCLDDPHPPPRTPRAEARHLLDAGSPHHYTPHRATGLKRKRKPAFWIGVPTALQSTYRPIDLSTYRPIDLSTYRPIGLSASPSACPSPPDRGP